MSDHPGGFGAAYLEAMLPGQCVCRECLKDVKTPNGLPLSASLMIVCVKCGNKRCPHATDHRNECTGSNEPGQPGSVYA